MNTKPKPLFSVKWSHTYFNEGIDNGLSLQPDVYTEKLFQRFGLKIFTDNNVSSCLSITGDATIDTLEYLINTLRVKSFKFQIHSNFDGFLCFTNLPRQTKCISYSTKDFLMELVSSRILLQPSYFQKSHAPYIGIFELFLEDIYLILSKKAEVLYEVKYEAIKTQWQYFIITRGKSAITNMSISSNYHIKFEGPIKVELPNKSQALKFTSGSTLIPLNATQPNQFNLVNSNKDNEEENSNNYLIKGLPSPSPYKISYDDGGTAISPMLVYI
ncbi:MAG: hypothetical protein KBH11_08460 [Bacteroidia bacterium]|nr:hypothetical protein [Bacteroidota bacterium]MBP9083095.1 hypothetical protein [Bacteroidia bacterium]MBK8415921.1 hypothetical protein [Bacteroidota bacterium]MBK8872438.1 hypothetical protein [Bacteroidota bacterium]MBK9046776.1 hypothetical protein [Bacteroidota bacterium]